MASAASNPIPPSGSAKIESVVLRNTLRYTISEKEYKTLHEYLITRSPKAVRRKAPAPSKFNSIVQSSDDFNTTAIRASLRVFVASQTSLKLWDWVNEYILAIGKPRR